MLYESVQDFPADQPAPPDFGQFELASVLRHFPMLSEPDELECWKTLERCTARLLLACTESPAGLELLKQLLEDISSETPRYRGEPSGETAEDLNLSGLIDELETLFHLDSGQVPTRRRHRLNSRLLRWAPPRHLVLSRLADAVPDWSDTAAAERMQRLLGVWFEQRNRLVNAHLGLVHSVAARFRYLGLSYDDLVQEGCLGLIKAIERFDWRKGFRFSTYAYRVIGQSIHLALDHQSTLVRKPFRMLRDKALVDKTRSRLEQQLGRAAKGVDLRSALPGDLPYLALHLDGSVVPDADSPILYAHAPEAADHADPDQAALPDLAWPDARYLLARLPDLLDRRTLTILRMRFGLGLGQEHTYEEIGAALSLSTERVRQITRSALTALAEQFT
jgi:RNA polymerase sigma factor (sigma-70 family)